MGLDRSLLDPKCLDEGMVILPISFVISGASNAAAATVYGNIVHNRLVTYSSAGIYTLTLENKPYVVLGGGGVLSGGTSEDITVQIDVSAATTTGVITFRFKTGSVTTAPADGNVFIGHLIVAYTDRRAGGP